MTLILERPNKILWCGNDCVLVQLNYNIILVGPDISVTVKMPSKNFAIGNRWFKDCVL